MKNWYVKMYVNNFNPCGMDYNYITKDLKTLKGLKNRMKNWSIPGKVNKIEIYNFTNVYDENTYKLIDNIEIPTSNKCFRNIEKYL